MLGRGGPQPGAARGHPRTGVALFHLSPEDNARFHHHFTNLPTLEVAHRQHRNTIAARLRAAGVQPFAPDRAGFGAIWQREEVEAPLR